MYTNKLHSSEDFVSTQLSDPYFTFFTHDGMYKNLKDPSKSFSFDLKDIDIGIQIQYLMCTGPLITYNLK